MELKITKRKEEANLITHSGTFHPDDVFSTMFLSKIIDNPVVARVNSIEGVNSNAIVYDIGYGKFDHHQVDAKYRSEFIKYSSFGLLWQEFGRIYIDTLECLDKEKLFNAIDEKLITQIDAIDNGYFPKITTEYKITDIDKIIDLFNPAFDEDVDTDIKFLEAVNIAQIIFDRLVYKENSLIRASFIVEESIPNVKNNILYLENYVPYKEAIFNSTKKEAKEIKVVILPSNRGGYNVKPMTVSKDSKEFVVNFPECFLGLKDEELQRVSGIKTAKFVHSNGFIASCETLEDAYLLANILLENRNE